METTEKIVEAYVRYVKNWFMLPNIKCGGQYDIDLLAVDIRIPRGADDPDTCSDHLSLVSLLLRRLEKAGFHLP